MYSNLIDTLRDPTVRDLAWVIGSPGLVDASHPAYQNRVVDDVWCGVQLQDRAKWLKELDLSPLPLHEFIAARPTRRLGHYFEALISFWLMHMPGTQLIAANLQVQDDQRTLGEYDFLFRDTHNMVCHWEAAIKFYLQLAPAAEQKVFIGPGARDRLDLKLDRIFQHQLLLGHTPAGQRALPQGVRLDKAQAFVKGYLFYHATTSNPVAINGVSATHLSGWWVRHKQEKLPQTSSDNRWIIPSRMHWLAPARLTKEANVMTYAMLNSKLDEHFNSSNEALLLIEMALSEDGVWQEKSRGFVVYETWPVAPEYKSSVSCDQ